MTTQLRVGSYNLWKNTAAHEIEALAIEQRLDVLCLQEVDATKLPPRLGELSRSASTERNRLGLAIYHRDAEWDAVETSAFTLPKALHDYLMTPGDERLLAVRLRHHDSAEEVVAASFHAAPLTSANSARRRQIRTSHGFLAEWAPDVPMLMVGDYNYPLFQGGLTEKVEATGHAITFSDRHTYRRYRYIRGNFDFVTSFSLRIDAVETLPKGASDHHPILVTASLG